MVRRLEDTLANNPSSIKMQTHPYNKWIALKFIEMIPAHAALKASSLEFA